MKEGRRQGFPYPKKVERYTPKRPTPEAGQSAPALLGHPEQLPHDGGLNAPKPEPPKATSAVIEHEIFVSSRREPLADNQHQSIFDAVHPQTTQPLTAEAQAEQKRAKKKAAVRQWRQRLKERAAAGDPKAIAQLEKNRAKDREYAKRWRQRLKERAARGDTEAQAIIERHRASMPDYNKRYYSRHKEQLRQKRQQLRERAAQGDAEAQAILERQRVSTRTYHKRRYWQQKEQAPQHGTAVPPVEPISSDDITH
jgi:hypothetical protein